MTGRTLATLGHDPEVVRETARRIVEAPPYRSGEPGVLRRTFEQLLDALGEVLSGAFGVVGSTPLVAWTIALLGIGVLGLLVWRATRGATLGRREPRVVPDGHRARAAVDWLADAERAEAMGDLDVALRYRYAGTVVTLEERGALDPRPGRTIRELDRELVVRRSDVAEPVAAAGERVEQVVFGGRAATPDDLHVADAALEAARRRESVGADT